MTTTKRCNFDVPSIRAQAVAVVVERTLQNSEDCQRARIEGFPSVGALRELLPDVATDAAAEPDDEERKWAEAGGEERGN